MRDGENYPLGDLVCGIVSRNGIFPKLRAVLSIFKVLLRGNFPYSPWELVEVDSVACPEGNCWTSDKSSTPSTIWSTVSLYTIYIKSRHQEGQTRVKIKTTEKEKTG